MKAEIAIRNLYELDPVNNGPGERDLVLRETVGDSVRIYYSQDIYSEEEARVEFDTLVDPLTRPESNVCFADEFEPRHFEKANEAHIVPWTEIVPGGISTGSGLEQG